MERFSSFRFLEVHDADDLAWPTDASAVVSTAQQRLQFLRLLRTGQLETKLLQTVQRVLAHCMAVRFEKESPAGGRRSLAAGCPPWRTLLTFDPWPIRPLNA